MDIANRFNPGDAIAGLKQKRKDLADADFNEMIDEINTTAQDENTLYGSIQKTGASITAVGAIGKGVLTGVQKLRAKLSGQDDDDAETGDGEADITGTETAEPTSAPQEVEMTDMSDTAPLGGATDATEAGANVGEFGGAATRQDIESEFGTQDTAPEGMEQSTFDDVMGDFRGDSDVVDTSYPEDTMYQQNLDQVLGGDDTAEAPFTRTPTDDLGTQQDTFEAQMRGEGDSEAGDLGDIAEEAEDVAGELGEGADTLASATDAVSSGISSAISAVRGAVSGATDAASSALESATSAVSGAVDSATSAVSGVVDAATSAGEVGAEVAGASALEAAGSALDATGVGAPIGLILNIIGGTVLAGTMTAGIVGDVEAGNEQTSATAQAQEQLKQATAGGMANIAGRYGV